MVKQNKQKIREMLKSCWNEQKYEAKNYDTISKHLLAEFSIFVPNSPFLYPPTNIRKPYAFLMFSVGRERVHRKQMG